MLIEVSYTVRDISDVTCRDIIEHHGGRVVCTRTYMPDMSRDVEAELPTDRFRACIEALRNKGYKASRRDAP